MCKYCVNTRNPNTHGFGSRYGGGSPTNIPHKIIIYVFFSLFLWFLETKPQASHILGITLLMKLQLLSWGDTESHHPSHSLKHFTDSSQHRTPKSSSIKQDGGEGLVPPLTHSLSWAWLEHACWRFMLTCLWEATPGLSWEDRVLGSAQEGSQASLTHPLPCSLTCEVAAEVRATLSAVPFSRMAS